MKKSTSLILCATAVTALATLSSCNKPAEPTAAPATPTATPAPTVAAAATPAVSTDATAPADAPATASPAAAATTAVIDLKDPVATVNGEPITKAALNEAFNNAIQAANVKIADLNSDQKMEGYRQLLDQLIMDKLVTKAAAGVVISQAEVDAEITKIKSQFPTEEDFKKQLVQSGQTPDKLTESLKKMLQQQRWIESQVADQTAVTDADAKAFYDANQAEFKQGEQVKAAHILFRVNKDDSPAVVQQKLDAAKKAIARAQKGEDFNKLAKELSEEPGAKDSGGDLPPFTKEQMVPEFSNAAFAQKIGTVSAEPVRTQFGWHVIKVTGNTPPHTVPYEEAKQQIIGYLKTEKQRKAVQELLKTLRDAAKIESTLPPAPPQPAMAPGAAAAPSDVQPSEAPATAPAPATTP